MNNILIIVQHASFFFLFRKYTNIVTVDGWKKKINIFYAKLNIRGMLKKKTRIKKFRGLGELDGQTFFSNYGGTLAPEV